ncbi:MAG: 3-hydroxyacyl-CoA dehydrogenase family protein [Hamadaea sp.]|uniref:3-hydroxyacyl-CoA dehydrogenase family protein n=1 Tax=Hamadaea sp. TaxID=2024425 RepID=UPI00183F0379|nr:3-hydroxyacyl-CoA dehydrogenase family protein [Hamadaea sp.]NUR69276.1 3-hydroxyacyl-CoA dehydrogenase family protein [Hamadaea sp.]NUT22020.1 3-hydroxyacyl-CoA dehydrogenase family protein [Hamadaea sp.]
MSASEDGGTARPIAIIGAGVMGTGIATMARCQGADVLLVDLDESILSRARAEIAQQSRHATLLGVVPPDRTPGKLTTTVDLNDCGRAIAVVEAVVESPSAKAKVLGEISSIVDPGTPLISNTSGIPVDEMAEWVSRPEDLVGTHFMNPAYAISMVEVIRGDRTGEATMRSVEWLMRCLNRKPIVVRDAPGFVTSRLLHPMINSAARIVGEGIASVAAVDDLMQGCLGHPTGPLRTADLIGIDNLVDSLAAMYERTGEPACRPCDLLLDKVREGDLGRKTGRGFYDYGKAAV